MVLEIKWDKWQREVLDYDGNIALRCGRQSGKSEVVSQKAVDFAVNNAGTTTMVIAASQRQSSLLFEKVVAKLSLHHIDLIKDKPTMTKVDLLNGSRIYCLPTGRIGHYIRGFTIDLLIADEAAYIPEAVWVAIEPTISISKKTKGFGHIVLLSTPAGKGGYFYNAFFDKDFRTWHVSAEDCPRHDKDFLRRKRLTLTKAQYKQEYLAEFLDEYQQFFPTELIKRRMESLPFWSLEKDRTSGSRFYLGVDVARYGGDQNAFVVCEMVGKRLKIVKVVTTERVSTVDTIGRIIDLERVFGFSKIFVDDGGVGGGVTDVLISRLGRRVVGLNNSARRFTMAGEERKKGILKEDLYSNALILMEQDRVDLIYDLDFLRSLKSITYEYTDQGRVKITGSYSHIAEAFVRAVWCVKDRGLRLFIEN